MSGTLVQLGVAAPKTLMQGKHDNPRGHWESEALATFHDELLSSAGSRWDDWRPFRAQWYDTPVAAEFKARAKMLLKEEFGRAPAFVLKDPRICRFPKFWLDILVEDGVEAKILLPLRSPLEVAQSHRARDGFSIRKGLLLWLRHVLDAEATSRDLPRCVFEWTDFLRNWRGVAGRIEAALGVHWPALTDFSASKVDSFLSGELRHETVSESELAVSPELHSWVIEAYDALRELGCDPKSDGARATLDRLREHFDDTARLFGGALADTEVAHSELQAAIHAERAASAQMQEQLRQERDQAIAAVQEERAVLREEGAALEIERRERATEADALRAERDTRASEVERLAARVEQMRESAEQAQASSQQAFESAMDVERQARAAQEEAHRAALDVMAIERDAQAQEIDRLSRLVEAVNAEAEKVQANSRQEFEATLDAISMERDTKARELAAALDSIAMERDTKAQEFAAALDAIAMERDTKAQEFTAALDAVATERDSKVQEINRLSRLVEMTGAEAEEVQAKLRLEFETTLSSEREAHEREIASLVAQGLALEHAIRVIHASRSWRATAPVRAASIAVRHSSKALGRAHSAQRNGTRFLRNILFAANPRRVGSAVKGAAKGDWPLLWNRLRWFGHGADLVKPASPPVADADYFARLEMLGSEPLPKFPNDRNYWLPQKLRDYLAETYGPAETTQLSILMDIVAAYGGKGEAFDVSPDLPVLQEWIRAVASDHETSDLPDVSIIIPVYNNLALTLAAIAAIVRCRSRYTYEIIVADDCSTDATAAAIDAIGGCVRHVRNETNLRFLLNCNNAAEQARGRFLVFLNNDTVALPGWLDNLIDPLEAHPDAGMTGSKLLNGDGTLQEAGGILWSDGSAWNFGRNQDPRLPEFNYLKEADYISGAAIALRADIWRRLGGFDPHFAPAYCEDSDLAFRVRRDSLKVLYAPHSEIIHHEGMSHGRDTGQGIKAYQVENTRKFAERWKATLQREHFANGQHVVLARDRSRGRPHILIVDHYVPEWDRDAGSRSMLDCIRFFLRCGFSVSFWPDNLNRTRRYTEALQGMGVEVIYGGNLTGRFHLWWCENRKYFSHVFLSRSHIAVNYIDAIRKDSSATVIYYGHDLPWKRLLLEYETTRLPKVKVEAERLKSLEDAVCSRADYIVYLSREECDYARGTFPDAKGVIEMPGWIFDEEQLRLGQEAIKTISDNQSCRALFVGGFAHAPNGDGVKWFLDHVAPLVRASEPRFVTVIVGSHMPEDIQQRAAPGVEIKGWTSDEELAELTRQAACTIAPLRFGAGVKGKVVSALAAGSPVVSTTIGMQGMDHPEQIAFVGDTARDFADAALKCLGDRPLAEVKARHALDFVRRRYSVAAMQTAFRPILPDSSQVQTLENGLAIGDPPQSR